MPNQDGDFLAWLTETRQSAQARAVSWAEQAQTHYQEAVRLEDSARAREDNAAAMPAYVRQIAAEEYRDAQRRSDRFTEAVRLAEMWARVATSLDVPALLPLLESPARQE